MAVIVWVPMLSDDVAKVALADASRGTVANGVAPSLNVTVPVAPDGVTEAVRVTAVPKVTGFGGEAVTAVVVEAFWTVTVIVDDVLPA